MTDPPFIGRRGLLRGPRRGMPDGSRGRARPSRWQARWAGSIGVVATGAVLAFATAGVVAQVRHEVVSRDNTLTSGVIEVGPGLAAALAVDGSCVDAAWTSDPIPAVLVGDVDLSDTDWEHLGPVLCLRNDSEVELALTVTGRDVTDSEDGDCQPSEQDAGDVTCADGEVGELGQVTTLAWTVVKKRNARTSCRSSDETAFTESMAGAGIGTIAVGEVCRFRAVARLADDADVPVAQTDRLRWDAVVTGEQAGEAARAPGSASRSQVGSA